MCLHVVLGARMSIFQYFSPSWVNALISKHCNVDIIIFHFSGKNMSDLSYTPHSNRGKLSRCMKRSQKERLKHPWLEKKKTTKTTKNQPNKKNLTKT